MTLTVVILAGCIMLLLAVGMAFVLGWANEAFHVEVDPKVEAVDEALPGANCGGCGYVGCAEYAEAVALEDEDVTKCTVGGASCAQMLAEIMGVEVEETWPYRAVVHCSAESHQRLQQTEYYGEQTCAAANVVAGVQGCTYGCLGLGDCVRSCEYDAIHVINGLARVDYDKCTGCGACIHACPRNIISRVPFMAERMLVVACSNKDSGAEVRKVCQTGCIGCKACSRVNELIDIVDNVAEINYDQYDAKETTEANEAALAKCPMEALVYVGKPTEDDKAAVADEEVPERIEADFKTTVDDTEWWG